MTQELFNIVVGVAGALGDGLARGWAHHARAATCRLRHERRA